MKIKQALLLFSLFSITSFAQQTFQFKGGLEPNSIYLSKMNSDMELKMQMDAPTENEELETSITRMIAVHDLQTKTFDRNANNEVPFELTYTNINMNSVMNGNKVPSDPEMFNPLYAVKLKGISNERGRENFVYEGPTQLEESFKGLLKSFESFTQYPTEVFKVGDSHSLSFTTDIPLQNGQNYLMEFVIKYTLKQLENDWAYFDVELMSDAKKQQLEGFVMGIDAYLVKGKMKVNVKDNNIYESDFEGPMKMTIQNEDLKLMMDYNYKYQLNSSKK